MMRNVLVIYWYNSLEMRQTVKDHLYCFKRYSRERVFYLNLAQYNEVPKYLREINFDLIIFHGLFCCHRWGGDALVKSVTAKAEFFKESSGVKVIMPQDEFLNAKSLCDLVNDFSIDIVFTICPESEWKKIYQTVDFSKVKFVEVLTGYIDDRSIRKIEKLKKKLGGKRPIDIGYRAGSLTWRQASYLGRHGLLKFQLPKQIESHPDSRGLKLDLSTRPQDVFMGAAWYEFISSCKYVIGIEGGSSVLDWTGTVRERTTEFVARNPEATLEEIEAACFPGLDGKLAYSQLSPRHLECCLTETCQILIEGRYNGILQPNVHYIPLKRDMSNLAQVLDIVKTDSRRLGVTNRAYADIVASGEFLYSRFVEIVFRECFSAVAPSTYGLRDLVFSLVKNRIVERAYFLQLQFAKIKADYKLAAKKLLSPIKHRMGHFVGLRSS